MVQSKAATVDEYLDELAPDRREVIEEVLAVIRENLPGGYEEGILWGMICWYIPLERYPDTYNGQPLGIAALAAQKRHYAVYLSIYDDDELREDHGLSVWRFDDLLDLVVRRKSARGGSRRTFPNPSRVTTRPGAGP